MYIYIYVYFSFHGCDWPPENISPLFAVSAGFASCDVLVIHLFNRIAFWRSGGDSSK